MEDTLLTYTVAEKYLSDVKTVFARELKRMTSSPLYLLITIILPLASFLFFRIIFHSGVPENLPVTIYDADNSQASRQIIRMIDATSLLKTAQTVTDIEQGKKLLLQGKSNALIILPENLEKDLLKGETPPVAHFYNNEFLLTGSLISKEVSAVIKTVSKGLNLSRRQAQNEMTEAAMAHIEPVVIEKHVLFNPYLNYFYYLTGALQPAMLQIFILTMTVFTFGIELKQGTAKALINSADGNMAAAVTGKLLPYSLIYIMMGLFMNIYLFKIPGFPFRGSLFMLVAATVLFVFACQAVGLLFISIAANLRMGLSAAGFYSATAFAFAGVTFPIIGMPTAAVIWSRLLPLTYYIGIFIDQSIKGVPVSMNIKDMCCLSFFIITCIPFAYFRMKTICHDNSYWGRS